jgi:hypothetical protein
MEANHVYAGCPAKDVTDKLGPQFAPRSVDEKLAFMRARLDEFAARSPEWKAGEIGLAAAGRVVVPGESMFDVDDRTYTKRRSATEVAFMRFLLPDAKFTPVAR